jgi:hypothetical protein
VDTFRKNTSPQAQDWPITESYYDGFLLPPVAEYTIMETMSPVTYTWGYLAAFGNGAKPQIPN